MVLAAHLARTLPAANPPGNRELFAGRTLPAGPVLGRFLRVRGHRRNVRRNAHLMYAYAATHPAVTPVLSHAHHGIRHLHAVHCHPGQRSGPAGRTAGSPVRVVVRQ